MALDHGADRGGPGWVRITFRIQPDKDGYPPWTTETMWAEVVGEARYRIDNVPFFARGVSLGDIVEAAQVGPELVFVRLVDASGHSTIRVVVFDASAVAAVRSDLENLGCSTELSHLPKLISVDVPPDVDLAAVRRYLQQGAAADRWDFEEAVIARG